MISFLKNPPLVGRLTKEMAKVAPYEKALGRRVQQSLNNYKMGLLDFGATGMGAGLGSQYGDEGDRYRNMMIGAALGGGARRLTSTPGGAAMLHNLRPNKLRIPRTDMTLGNLGMQTGRSAYGGRR